MVVCRVVFLLIGLGEGEFFCVSDMLVLVGFICMILLMEDGEVVLFLFFGVEFYDVVGVC